MGICTPTQKKEFNQNYKPINIFDNSIYSGYDLDDDIFKSIREEIEKILIKDYNSKTNYFVNEINNYLNNKQNLNFVSNLSERIINMEGGKELFNERIKNEIEIINNDKEKFKIKYLTIMVIGQTGTGKSTLINSLLQLEGNNKAPTGMVNIVTTETRDYMNRKVPYLRLVDTRGIELSKIADIDAIGKEAKTFMEKQQKPNRNGEVDFNNFVHCIWYCVESNRFQEAESNLITKLKETYEDSKIPIIIVMTQAINEERYEGIKNFLEAKNYDFVKVLAERLKIYGDHYVEPFGLNDLINLTLQKCKKAFNGDMKAVMIKNMSYYIENKIRLKKLDINQSNILNINEYDKEGNNFQEYIKNLYKSNIQHYLNNNDLKNETCFLINSNSSEFVKHKTNYFLFCQDQSNIIIEQNISLLADQFLDIQAKKQIQNNQSVKNINRRDKVGLIKTSTKFLIKKYKLLAYNYYSNYIKTTMHNKIIISFEEKINSLIKNLLNKNEIKDSINEKYEKKFNDFENRVKEFKKNSKNIIIRE